MPRVPDGYEYQEGDVMVIDCRLYQFKGEEWRTVRKKDDEKLYEVWRTYRNDALNGFYKIVPSTFKKVE